MVKSYVISVSLGTGCYRHIQISASATLGKLHRVILSAFGFSDDHQHAFFMNNRLWEPFDAYFSTPFDEGTMLTSQKKLKQLKLEKGDKFKYLFDFGDEWVFQCKVLRELDIPTDIPGVIRSVGAAPQQYPEALEDRGAFPSIYPFERVKELFAQLPVSSAVIQSVHQYFDAAAQLYGVVPLQVILKLYNDQNPPVAESDFLAIAEVIRHEANDYCILGSEALYRGEDPSQPMDRMAISTLLLEIGGIELFYEVTDKQEDKPFLVLPQEEFLRYAVPGYLPESPQLKAMRQFLQKNKKRFSIPAEDLLMAVYTAVWLDLPLQYTADGLEEVGFQFRNQAEIKTFMDLYQELSNHTGKAVNRGASPKELRAQWEQKQKQKVDARHVLRDPNQISLLDD